MPSYCGAATKLSPVSCPCADLILEESRPLQQDLEHDISPLPPSICSVVTNHCQPASPGQVPTKDDFQLSACLRKAKRATKPEYLHGAFLDYCIVDLIE
jgi:hypothetical protein